MIVFRPVLEVLGPDGFALWPVADVGRYDFLPLGGALTPDEVGTAVMSAATHNSVAATRNSLASEHDGPGPEGDGPAHDAHPPRPADPVGDFLHGLLAGENLFLSGGLWVTDTTTGATLLPGCCNGLEERGDWRELLDGVGWASFGHDPGPFAERVGDLVRLTVDAEQDGSPVIELPVTELPRLLADAERDLTDFLRLATEWAARQLPEHAALVSAALARALGLPANAT
ncbi:hypothetical protein [Streptomyces sp. NPDC003077]|uniref:hypothetical protein n=1 Tax=Streptomyces sp. NPDC003077 TaxID=3154443 RepID=UPI0033BB71AD